MRVAASAKSACYLCSLHWSHSQHPLHTVRCASSGRLGVSSSLAFSSLVFSVTLDGRPCPLEDSGLCDDVRTLENPMMMDG